MNIFNIFFEFEEKVSCRFLGGAGPMVMVFDLDPLIHGAPFVLGSSRDDEMSYLRN